MMHARVLRVHASGVCVARYILRANLQVASFCSNNSFYYQGRQPHPRRVRVLVVYATPCRGRHGVALVSSPVL